MVTLNPAIDVHRRGGTMVPFWWFQNTQALYLSLPVKNKAAERQWLSVLVQVKKKDCNKQKL